MEQKYPGVQIEVNPTAPRKKSFEISVLPAGKAAEPGTRPTCMDTVPRPCCRALRPYVGCPRVCRAAVVVWTGLGKGPAERYPATADVLAERIDAAVNDA